MAAKHYGSYSEATKPGKLFYDPLIFTASSMPYMYTGFVCQLPPRSEPGNALFWQCGEKLIITSVSSLAHRGVQLPSNVWKSSWGPSHS